jgi:DNA-binding transcriptional LysR family regulator
MELRHVRYFVAVAETLSFRQAGKQLHVSQPSLSVQIKQLEEELGVALFRRSKRRVEITRAGEVFLSAAREILLRLRQASAAAFHAESGEEEQSDSGSFRRRASKFFPGYSRRSEALCLS